MMSWQESAALHAAAEYPRESCGLVVRIDGDEVYWPCRNLSDSDDAFQISPADLIGAEDAGATIIGVVHSHPDQAVPRPGRSDIEACDSGSVPWHVLGWPSGRWVSFVPQGQIPPLAGRKFAHGTVDCYTLIRDWYRLHRGVVLPDFQREEVWWERGGDLYRQGFAEAGFAQHDGPPENGDVLLIRWGARVPNHAAIYLAGDQIAHHLAGQLSCTEPWGCDYRERTMMILRYVGGVTHA